MTAKPPSQRLVDVLHRNSKETLERHAAELARASTALSAETLQTRFSRNQMLVSPKALQLIQVSDTLARWKLFAAYKPPFCPMRRAQAVSNHHRVSMESFIEAALKSRDVAPVMQRELSPDEVRIRVLNDVDLYASGPVVVSVADAFPHATSLQHFSFEYDVLVAGHLPLGTTKSITPEALYSLPSAKDESRLADVQITAGSPAGKESAPETTCTLEVRLNAYYSVHPVSLLNVRISAPPSPRAPCIEKYVREHFHTCVIGDPVAMGNTMTGGALSHRTQEKCRRVSEGANPTDIPVVTQVVASMRGDIDFPRVFTHLREVRIGVDVRDVSGCVVGHDEINFHCRKCFDPLLQKTRVYSMKRRRIGLLDGSWTLQSEFL